MRSVETALARRRIEIGRCCAVSGTSAEHGVGFGGTRSLPHPISRRASIVARPPQPSQAARHDTSPYWARARQWLCPWVGVYRRHSLIEVGIAPDIVCGTSIGALIGAARVAGRLAELRQ